MRQRGMQYAAWIVVGAITTLCRTPVSADDLEYVSAFDLDPIQTQPLTVVVPEGMVCTNADDVVMAGYFGGQTDFDPGPGTANLTGANGASGFLLKFDSDQQYLWSAAFISSAGTHCTDVDVDSSANVLVCGHYDGTIDLDPGAGTANASSAGTDDIFVAKLDSTGNHLWSFAMGGTFYDGALAIASDSLGNVYVAGYSFSSSVDFDPGIGTANVANAGIFVLKLDASGDFVWVRNVSVTSGGATELLIDSNGDVVVGGGFEDTADFDPGAGVTNLTSVGNSDAFLLKLDAAGAFVWAKSFGGSLNDSPADLIETGAGDLLLTGDFELAVDFDPGPGSETRVAVGGNGYVLKLDSNGSFEWVQSIGGDEPDYAWALDVDAQDNIVVTGDFSGTVDFDAGPANIALTATSASDGYILRLYPNGDFRAVGPLHGPGYETPNALRIDSTDRAHLAGRLYDSADLDPGPATATFNSDNGGDGAYVIALDLGPMSPLPVSTAWTLTVLGLLLALAASIRFVRYGK